MPYRFPLHTEELKEWDWVKSLDDFYVWELQRDNELKWWTIRWAEWVKWRYNLKFIVRYKK